ncbi:hypothetical protein A8C56_07245 [Niabella ginsenosidivorans]|uniref:DUF1345 domain-containing protein n=1 Tax=Niabella ginsenosidivorans TaxID=1176587 RepID=A0A1A9I7V7_9BACT|nr:DUF1345 domain-containing protein [Niabella ginsenosidivorans]ANH83767.1 hypothetical protein A8C56_07245 [Niabella ginsenosidivorans]
MQNKHPFKEKKVHKLLALQRLFISFIVGGIAGGITSFFRPPVMMDILIGWLFFCCCYLLICWYIIYTTPHEYIVKKAAVEDGGRAFVFIFILITCFACLAAVLSIIINAKENNLSKYLWIPVSVGSIVASWLLVHTIYIFHYAHLYYQDGEKGCGLKFPEDDQPNYLDFAYYSLCMGCTFQVSDVNTTSKQLRYVTMYHGLISFALNTFLVALTINIISGLIH